MSLLSLDASFRRESSKLVSVLVREFGVSRLGIVEDAVQEAFYRALRVWPLKGEPASPTAWLNQVARRVVLDSLRREGIYSDGFRDLPEFASKEPPDPTVLGDAELEMLFLCCHPALSTESQISLTLRELCGLSTREIAKGLLVSEEAMSRRLVRAKRSLAGVDWTAQEDQSLQRYEAVLTTLYLMFNEGYTAHSDPGLTRSDLCDEAILLTHRLSRTTAGNKPATHALLALMLFHSSRLPARVSSDGSLCLLEDQDRSLWDRDRINRGLLALERSANGTAITRFHFEAAIAVEHALAARYEDTKWSVVLNHYNGLAALAPTPVILLNRAIALAMVEGPAAGLLQLDACEASGRLHGYYLLPSTKAKLMSMLGNNLEARDAYEKALSLAQNPSEQAFLKKKIAEIQLCATN